MPGCRWLRVKDPFCGLSHAFGAVLSAAGLAVLLVLAGGRWQQTLGFTIYGLALVALYSSSALYHSLTVSDRHLLRLQQLDFIGIFLLIAGTYTPVCLVVLHGAWEWGILSAEWGMAVLGIAGILLLRSMPSPLRVTLYVVMGWLAVVALGPLRSRLPASAIMWMLAGGITYSLGTVIYAVEKPNLLPGRFEAHDLWHVFVLCGSFCHYVMMLYLV